MNDDRQTDAAGTTTGRGNVARLRLVSTRPSVTGRSLAMPAGRPAVALLPGVYDIRFTSSRRPGVPKNGVRPGPHDQRRLDVRHEKGNAMNPLERITRAAGRFAVALGTALALVCAVVIVRTDPGLGAPTVATGTDVVRLAPVVVTISANRYAEVQAALRAPSAVVRGADHGVEEG